MNEQAKARQEACCNASETEYFGARPQIDTLMQRHNFCAGFYRGYAAAIAAAPAQPECTACGTPVQEDCPTCMLPEAAQPAPSTTPAAGIPGNFITHRPAWRDGLAIARALATGVDVSYWDHEIAAFDRSFDRLWTLMEVAPTPPGSQPAPVMAYPPLPARHRAFLCTKCGSRECEPGTIEEVNPPCKCGYLGFAEDLDFTASQMRAYVDADRAARAAPQPATEDAVPEVRQFLAMLAIRNRQDNGMFPQVAAALERDDAALDRIRQIIDHYYPRAALAAQREPKLASTARAPADSVTAPVGGVGDAS